MSNPLRRQIDLAKTDLKSIKPKPIVPHKLMGIRQDASGEEKAAYQDELARALADGVFVIQLVGLRPLRKD